MQKIIPLKSPNEIDDYLYNLWQTSEFKKSHKDSNSYIYSWIKDFTKYPRFFAQMSNEHIERAHFTPWFNVIYFRSYSNPYIHDLYLLHEIIHLVTLQYQTDSWSNWRQKMFDNEMITSLYTEVEIYNHLPIRDKSFTDSIWADKIKNSYNSFQELISLRQRAMINPQDESEKIIAQYAKNNEIWAEIWKRDFIEVENHMQEFYKKTDPQEAIDFHLNWLKQNSQDFIPFKLNAELFARVYWGK